MSDSLQPHGLQHTVFHCLSFTVIQTLLKFMSIGLVMPSGHLLCHPLLLLLSVFPSTRVFSKESKCQASLCMRFFRQEYWSGLPCPLRGDLPDPGTKPCLLCLLHCRRILYYWATREACDYSLITRKNGSARPPSGEFYVLFTLHLFLHSFI